MHIPILVFNALLLGLHAPMILVGAYIVLLNRVPPPRQLWGDSPSRLGKLLRPRLLGIWYLIWWGVLTLVAVLQVITGEALLLSLWSVIAVLMGLSATNRRFAKLGIPRGVYQHPSGDRSVTSSESDDMP
jgi:hypothetical protein